MSKILTNYIPLSLYISPVEPLTVKDIESSSLGDITAPYIKIEELN